MFQIVTRGGYFLHAVPVDVYPFEHTIMTKKNIDTAGLVRTAYYSRYSGKRVSEKWAKHNHPLVEEVTFYGGVDVAFLKRGHTFPSTYDRALDAHIHQLSTAGVLDIPRVAIHFSLRTGKVVSERFFKRNPGAVWSFTIPAHYDTPKNRKEAMEMEVRFGREIDKMLLDHAIKLFKAENRPGKLGGGGKIVNRPSSKTPANDNEKLLLWGRKEPTPKSDGVGELLKHVSQKVLKKEAQNIVDALTNAGKKRTGTGASMDTFVPRGTTRMGSMD